MTVSKSLRVVQTPRPNLFHCGFALKLITAMYRPPAVPELDPQELARKLRSAEDFVLLDVREAWELALTHLDDPRLVHLPLSRLARQRNAAFPQDLLEPDREIVVICHHGVRSAQVTAWMLEQGWRRVSSLAGGLDAYARSVDPSTGLY